MKIDASGGEFSVSVEGIPEDKFREYADIIAADLQAIQRSQPDTYNEIVGIAAAAERGELSKATAAEKIAYRLPERSAAAIKKLGALDKLQAAATIVTMITGLIGAGVAVSTALRPPTAISAPAPATPSITINNHITFVDKGAAENTGSVVKPPVIKREAARRLRQMERQRAKQNQKAPNKKPKGKQ